MVAGIWSATSIASIGPLFPTECNRCKQHPDDLHLFRTCPCLQNIPHKNISKTQHLVPLAVEGSITEPCLWLRGILPSHHTQLPGQYATPTVGLNIFRKQTLQAQWDSNTYYGDASGGEFSSFPRIRRVGCGVVV